MAASNTFNVRLRVLKENKSKYVPFMERVSSYKVYFYQKCKDELSTSIDDSFAAVQLAEALSLNILMLISEKSVAKSMLQK